MQPPLEAAGRADAPRPHLPSAGQSQAAAEDVAVLPWNDTPALEAFLAARGQETAALIMEPILCNTGVILPRPGYLEAVRQLCDRHGVVLIFDEVITGFRVGPGGAQGRLGVLPDLAVYAKALGAGFPIAALAGSGALMEHLGDGSTLHGGTYNTNLVSTSAATAALDGAGARRGRRLRAARGPRGGPHGGPARARPAGRGAAAGAGAGAGLQHRLPAPGGRRPDGPPSGAPPEGVSDYRAYAGLDAARQRAFLRALQDGGVRVTARGTWFLSTAHSEADVEETLRVAGRALRAV